VDPLVIDLLRRTFHGRRVLVTGDTGFKGSWLCAWLLELGADVYGYALPAEQPSDLYNQLGLARRIKHVDADIRDHAKVMQFFREVQPEFVLHLAAQSLVRPSYADPKGTFDTNVAGSVNILEAVRATPSVRSLVYVTSDKCYRNKEWVWGYRETDELGGRDPYSASKAAAEIVFSAYCDSFFAHRDGFGAASVRAGNVIGGGDWATDRIVPDCLRALQRGDGVQIRNPGSTRPWQHVLDPLSGYLLIAARLAEDPKRYGGAWNFGPVADDVRTVGDLANEIVRVWGSGVVGKRAEVNPPHEAGMLWLSCDKARQGLHWKAQWHFERAVRETVEWYKQVGLGADAAEVTRRQLLAYMENAS
jgi:CDP-glucose 4,6-dehydratase